MIVRASDGTRHEAEEVGSGVMTGCGKILDHGTYQDSKMSADCPSCLSGETPETTAPSGLRKQRSKNPQHRQARNLYNETVENARHAHKEIVAGLEWLDRGSTGQFVHEALGRLHLAQRFLTELLVSNGIIEAQEDCSE